MANNETPEGLRLLYDSLVKASEYPGESAYNPRNLYSWGKRLKALHQIMSAYHDAEYLQEYRLAQKNILELSGNYPSERYIAEGYAALYEWLGSLSRLYQRLGLMIPQNLSSPGRKKFGD